MGDLTANFSRWEYECQCNYPECLKFWMDEEVVLADQTLRDILGVSITISSGCRCPKHNRDIGGSPTSKHLKGLASDKSNTEVNVLEIFEAALSIPIFREGGIGIYFDEKFVHTDGREERVRWTEEFGVWRPSY